MQIMYLTKNTPGVRKGAAKNKTGLAEKDVKSNGQPRSLGFHSFFKV